MICVFYGGSIVDQLYSVQQASFIFAKPDLLTFIFSAVADRKLRLQSWGQRIR
uniref:Uncharacterized protein n=1 Tax=Ralstonia solanacearum CFBP2957 TaxID=859656 RepID=D8P3D9_RALSL|nr:protein of unknown function [Ralstonia solanacearum CFBP2957]